MTEIEHKGSKLKVDVSDERITKEWKIDEPYHEVQTELKFKAKRVHVAAYFDQGKGPWQFHVADSGNMKSPNSFRDLALPRYATGNYGTEMAREDRHTLTQAKQDRVDKMKALAKAKGSTKRQRDLDF